jgi:hypothetical protein
VQTLSVGVTTITGQKGTGVTFDSIIYFEELPEKKFEPYTNHKRTFENFQICFGFKNNVPDLDPLGSVTFSLLGSGSFLLFRVW